MSDECQCQKCAEDKVAAVTEGMDRLYGHLIRDRREYYRAMWRSRCDGLWLNRAKFVEMRNERGRTVVATFDVSPSDTSVVPDVQTVQIGFTSPFMTVDDSAICLEELLDLLARGWNEEKTELAGEYDR